LREKGERVPREGREAERRAGKEFVRREKGKDKGLIENPT
jgi:hypothetical protein